MAPREVGVKDLTRLNNLDEKSILENLRVRFQSDLIYTYVGNILVAVNPYRPLAVLSQKEFDNWKRREKVRPLSVFPFWGTSLPPNSSFFFFFLLLCRRVSHPVMSPTSLTLRLPFTGI